MTLTKQGRVEGSSIVFTSPLPLSDGTQVNVQIETLPEATSAPLVQPADFAGLPFFGMWADREDMEDSSAWVGRERNKWQQRTAHRD